MARKDEKKTFFKLGVLDHAVAGIGAGSISTLIFHPADMVKTRMQVRAEYKSTRQAFMTIFRQEGLTAFYSGLTPNLAGNASAWGAYFLAYNAMKKGIEDFKKAPLKPTDHLLAGAGAGFVGLTATNPIWVIKARMMLQMKQRMAGTAASTTPSTDYKGVLDGMWKLWRAEGFGGLYRGYVMGLVGVGHGAIQFAAYEELKQLVRVAHKHSILSTSALAPAPSLAAAASPATRKLASAMEAPKGKGDGELSQLEYTVTAGLAKIIAATIMYPEQVIRTRLMDVKHSSAHARKHTSSTPSSSAASPQVYSGTIDCIRKMWVEGPSSFYRGWLLNTVRVTPAAIIVFVSYENIRRALSSMAEMQPAKPAAV